MTAADQLSSNQSSGAALAQMSRVYSNTPITLKFLEAFGWGGELLNLGYFKYSGLMNVLNLIPDPNRLAWSQRNLVEKSCALLAPHAADKILDVACGRGYASHYLAKKTGATAVTGMDLLPENIESCRQRFGSDPGISFVVGDACRMGLPAGEFTKVLCLEAAFHFPDRAAFLAEAYRVLANKGQMVLVDFMWKSPDRKVVAKSSLVNIVKKTWAWDDFSSVSEYLEMIANSGFELTGRHDWTREVTGALQWQFNMVARLARTRTGRNILVKTNPALARFKPSEWQEIQTSAKAHEFVNNHSRYMALVVKKR